MKTNILKLFAAISGLCFLVGCHPGMKYTTSTEYIEEWEVGREGGVERCPKATRTFSWEPS